MEGGRRGELSPITVITPAVKLGIPNACYLELLGGGDTGCRKEGPQD